jgi:hypothetical protein
MASLIFAHAKSIYKRARAYASEMEASGLDRTASYNKFVSAERAQFRAILELAKNLHDDYTEFCQPSKHYFITVRPKPEVAFDDFYDAVHKWIERKCVISYKLSFEQKGTEVEDLGKGFHVHMVLSTTHRSKGECLRDACSTFKHVAAENCIDCKPTKNGPQLFKSYCIEYKSEDGHKEPTLHTDEAWRKSLGLQAWYDTDETPLPGIE